MKRFRTFVKGVYKVAMRGGLGSGTGSTNPVAVLCESITLPSELGHTMTIFASVIWVPNPLKESEISNLSKRKKVNNLHGHPPQLIQSS